MDRIYKALQEGKQQKTVVLNEEELQTVTADLSKLMESLNTDIKFSIHKASGRMMVRVVDSKTQDVLKEFPPEELLDTIGAHHAAMWMIIAIIGGAQTLCFFAFVRRRATR